MAADDDNAGQGAANVGGGDAANGNGGVHQQQPPQGFKFDSVERAR